MHLLCIFDARKVQRRIKELPYHYRFTDMLHFPLSFPREVSRSLYVVYRQRRSGATQTTTSSYLPALTPLLFLPADLGHGESKVGSG